ncbi:TRAP transporter small permease [Ramlibacter tataouinensis]|uniref:TRAP transporter small permease protein n=1 Tax=Ramlibacter tataouinensis (strain ATCC BAA-407 / DSM 14655 / LMG 21543 / TTB310) TaxID=365046 RepID=F5Y0Y7_RAMTT|nr:TRAP transporter small permease [Ramlibacter tataouinensis]AEG92205.1 Candidate small permease component [Ramlibacter tataouinensis TTB310]
METSATLLQQQPSAAWERAFVALNRWALIGLLAAMAVLVIANVVSRYLFLYSFTWVEEATRYMMVWVAFLGAGLALRVGGHIAIDSLHASLPPGPARVVRGVIVAVLAVTLLVVAWLGWDYAQFAWEQETPVLGWSFGKVYLAIPVGAVLMLCHLALVARQWVGRGEWERLEGFDPQAL